MAQPKVQLVAPIGNINLPGMTATGVVTATSLSGIATGSVTNLTGSPDLDVGIVTGSSFVGDGTGHAASLTGTPNLNLGVTTATSFVGDAVGKAAGLTGTPNLNVGLITATSFVGFVTGDVTGNISGLAVSVTPGVNLGLGVCTAIQYHGDGSALTGAGASAYIAQEVTATGAETIIDLSYGNLIYYDSSSNTTVGFASTSAAEQITFIRDTGDSYTITWPDRVKWSGGTTPTLLEKIGGFQIFNFTTFDTGLTYNGWSGAVAGEGNKMFMWGSNTYGMLGQNTHASPGQGISSPIQVGSENTWNSLAVQQKHTLATKSDGTLWAWGQSRFGQLGLNQSGTGAPQYLHTQYSSPVQVGTDTDWNRTFFTGDANSAATKTNGELWIWGQSNSGNLGLSNNTNISSPAQIPGTTWSELSSSAGGNNAIALKTDGTLWAWGYNYYGGLGHNNRTSYSSPKQVGTNTNWTGEFGTGAGSFGAVKTDGTLWTCGRNTWGESGRNIAGDAPGTAAGTSSPSQVGTDTTWNRVSGAVSTFMATKTDGTLWAWGYGNYGMLGLNQGSDNSNYSSPTQIPGTNWAYVKPMNLAFIGSKTDGTLWSWGYNFSGQGKGKLGLNDTGNRSSPTQIPGTWDISKLTSSYHPYTIGAFKP